MASFPSPPYWQRGLLLSPPHFSIITPLTFDSEKTHAEGKKVLRNGLESSTWMGNWVSIPWLNSAEQKQKERTLRVWQKRAFPLDVVHWLVAQLSYNHEEFQCLLVGSICFRHFKAFELSTSWAGKNSLMVRFQKPLLVIRAPSAWSFIQLSVCACLLNALFPSNYWLLELLQDSLCFIWTSNAWMESVLVLSIF